MRKIFFILLVLCFSSATCFAQSSAGPAPRVTASVFITLTILPKVEVATTASGDASIHSKNANPNDYRLKTVKETPTIKIIILEPK